MTLTRKSPMKRGRRKDPVSSELRAAVLERDGGNCAKYRVAPNTPDNTCHGPLTLDHVQDGYGRMGKRAPSDMAHLVTLCVHHHLDGWATSHRPELRAYLEGVNR